jgi:hypothetical protein
MRQFSHAAAIAYRRSGLRLSRFSRVEPSILLHPLDFLGGDEEPDLAFFPAMKADGQSKRAFVTEALELLAKRFEIVTMAEHARAALGPAKASLVPSSRAAP